MLENPQDESSTESLVSPVREAVDRMGLARAALLAEGALRLAQRLRAGGLNEMAEDAGSMARAAPMAYLGGTILLGVAVARFLKSSRERARMAGAAEPF